MAESAAALYATFASTIALDAINFLDAVEKPIALTALCERFVKLPQMTVSAAALTSKMAHGDASLDSVVALALLFLLFSFWLFLTRADMSGVFPHAVYLNVVNNPST